MSGQRNDVTVEVGQVWRENDKRFTRFVRVLKVWAEVCDIQRCNEDGTEIPDSFSPVRRAQTRRFLSKKYLLVTPTR